MLPNVPQPKNGMIRTYENASRTFTRPYSAKTVFFYKEGDEYFTGVRIPVSKSRYRTIDSLLDDLNTNIPMPYGVRRLMTPMGRNEIQTIDDLQHLGKYVATSGKTYRGLNFSGVERLQKAREAAAASLRRVGKSGQSFWIPASPSYRQKLRMSRTLGINVQPSKQIFFVLNGKTKLFRMVLNPIKMPNLELLLSEVSNGLEVSIDRFYTFEGRKIESVEEIMDVSPPKIIAVPRAERLQLREKFTLPSLFSTRSDRTASTNFKKNGQLAQTNGRGGLPPTTLQTGSSNSFADSNSLENRIDKQRKQLNNARKNTRKMTGAPKRKIQRRIPSLDPPNSATTKSDDSGKAPSVESSVRTSNGGVDAQSHRSIETSGSDYPESAHHSLAGSVSSRVDEMEQVHQGNRHGTTIKPDTPDNIEGYLSSDDEDDDEKRERAAITIQAHYRGYRTRKVLDVKKDIARQHGAATIIQAGYRGYRVRKGNKISLGNEGELVHPSEYMEIHVEAATKIQANYPSLPEYSAEHEAAAIKIQAGFRGYKTRRELKKQKEMPEYSDEHTAAATTIQAAYRGHRIRKGNKTQQMAGNAEDFEAIEEIDEEDLMRQQNEAATKIQAAYRGYRTRKQIKHVAFVDEEPEMIDGEMEILGNELIDGATEVSNEVHHKSTQPSNGNKNGQTIGYTISVLTGNRWGADSETDLYITLQGDDGTSVQFWLKPEVLWLKSETGKFKNNQLDSFHVESAPLGTLNKVLIGHEKRGYGAGIFIEHILVTENVVDGRQFVFFCSKWLDSGQVDGKIERSLPVSAFYYISSIPEDGITSHGRWEFILHNGTPDGQGGTTSNLNIVGYGTEGSSVTTITTDKSLQQVPSTSLIQVDFGEIGDLLKVRFEIDGSGERPDYFLEYVELRDLDTEERLAVRVGKWLDVTGAHKKPQPYREISVFRAGMQPLSLNTYEGKVLSGETSLLSNDSLRAQLIGEFSDSGIFPLITGADKKEYSFKAECVYLGRIQGIRVIGDFKEKGEAIFEGLAVIQDIWDRRGVQGINMAPSLLSMSAFVRESTHCPYRYVLANGRVQDLPEEAGLYHKQLTLTEMEGLPTRNKKDKRESEQDSWTLSMSVKDDSDVIPYAEICAGPSTYEMNPVQETPKNNEINYQMRGRALGTVDKVRLGVRGQLRGGRLHVKRMRLSNALTGEEMRFPSVDTIFHDDAVYEYPTVYPDVPPRQNIVYTVQLETMSVGGTIQPCATVIGRDGGSGRRALHASTIPQSMTTENYEIEAVDLGPLESIELWYEADTDVEWQVVARVASSKDEVEYQTGQIVIRKSAQRLVSALGVIV
ncbi:unnamed protein product, partial [Mesorhabditis belari]|uniref:Uncharacterized protein n=1 Tax=Mesorhabditis belari TaxID=2138241 RepID=A0AAF3FE15_9BILA